MPRFDDYLSEVQQRNGLQPIPLIRAWTQAEVTAVEAALRAAVLASNIINSAIPNFAGISNQAKGNKAADHFVKTVPQHLPAPNRIIAAKGSGYPDRIFSFGQLGFCMELKATANWKNGDGNRRVLTSSPEKMRKLVKSGHIGNPPAHLVCTVFYGKTSSLVTGVRLDFLEPDSIVNIRLEASTSQKLLTSGSQHKATIP